MKGFDELVVKMYDTPHYIYYKKHEGRDGRSLFVVNLPALTALSDIKKFFGEVAIGATVADFEASVLNDYPEEVWVNMSRLTSDLDLTTDTAAMKLPKNCAIIAFVDKPAFQLAMAGLKKAAKTQHTWPQPQITAQYYADKLRRQIKDPEALALEVLDALAAFDEAEHRSQQALRQEALVDADGFTMVVGSNRKTKLGILGKQKLAQTVEADKASAKMKKKEKDDFYRFQMRQRKKEEMNDLLRKYKEDQERVQTMREKKRFRPY